MKDNNTDNQKPPLGLMPEWRHKELRLQEIREAIQRYLDVNKAIQIEWVAEEYALRNWLENREEVKVFDQKKFEADMKKAAEYFAPKSESQSKGKGWEIVCFRHKSYKDKVEICNGMGNGYSVNQFLNDPINSVKSGDFEIYSVKRLSDGEVFSVGDEHGGDTYKDGRYILEFYIEDGEMLIKQDGGVTRFENLRKPAPKQPLFTTEDGKPVCEWNLYWIVDKGSYRLNNISVSQYESNYLYFSTEEAAKEYILMNKPCLSVQDVMNRLHAYFQYPELALQNIKQFSKSKLSQ